MGLTLAMGPGSCLTVSLHLEMGSDKISDELGELLHMKHWCDLYLGWCPICSVYESAKHIF